MKDRTFSGRRVVLSVPSRMLSIFPVHFQVGEGASLEEAILTESEKALTFPLGEAIVDYPSLVSGVDGNPKSYKALVVAIRREDLKRYLALAGQAGLRVEALDFSGSALLRLHGYLYGSGRNQAILGHIGDFNSLLVVATQESITAHRDLLWGSDVLLKEFLATLDVSNDRDQARAMLKRYGLSFDDREETRADEKQNPETIGAERTVYQIITPHIDEFLLEVDKAVGYVRVEERYPEFEGIYLYDHASLVPALDKYVERRLNIRTEVVNPLEKIPLSNECLPSSAPEDATFALALGLAMRRVTWP
jgi:Tfp pilus assembly PilM family ATPase